MIYAEITNDKVQKIHSNLPECWRNISNFFALESELLADLSWSGNNDTKFYPYIEQKPEILPDSQLVGPNYVIDHENHQVIGVFQIVPVPPRDPFVPQTISARQVRLWLLRNNINLDMVNQAINSIENSTIRDNVSIEWEYAPYIERNHPMLVSLAEKLGLNPSDIDRAFIEGGLL